MKYSPKIVAATPQSLEAVLTRIVDQLFDTLLHSCGGDEVRARQFFVSHSRQMNELCQRLVQDVQSGALRDAQIASRLVEFVDALDTQ